MVVDTGYDCDFEELQLETHRTVPQLGGAAAIAKREIFSRVAMSFIGLLLV